MISWYFFLQCRQEMVAGWVTTKEIMVRQVSLGLPSPANMRIYSIRLLHQDCKTFAQQVLLF